MGAVIPNVMEIAVLELYAAPTMFLRLFSNDIVPTGASVAADFTEVIGGGYVEVKIEPNQWAYKTADPSQAKAPVITIEFTGPTTAPGTVFGYYIVRGGSGELKAAERFIGSYAGIEPVKGSSIRITPTLVCS